jgi:arylsulfatase A-like enzyme
MKLQHVIVCVCFALIGIWIQALPLAAAPQALPRPNVLLIMPDQMRGDCLSILGHPGVHTPHLDELARQGALFRRAYTTVPSCIPARHALLTGQFPQTSGLVGFAGKPITTPTLPGLLAQGGYTTVLVGRYMHQVPANEPYGYQRQILGSTHVDNDDYDRFLQQAVPASGGIRKLVQTAGLTYNGWQAAPWPLADELHPTAWIVRESRQVVAETAPAEPLFLTVSFYAPHPPLFPPQRFFDACLRRNLPDAARGGWVDWQGLPPNPVNGQAHRVRLEGDALRRTQAGYFAAIDHIDEQIGPLVAEFKARSEKAGRPWVIVVTSDHGELLGDHGFFRKCEPYEGSANIPLILAASPDLGGKPAARCLRPTCLEDILPTLLDLAGLDRPAGLDGVSLAPVLRGQEATVRPWLHFEHATCYSPEQAFHALTDGRFKYIWRPTDGGEQLFDLETDVKEEHDLAADPSHRETLDAWRERMVKRLAGRPEGFSDGSRLIPGRPYRARWEAK